MLAAALGVILWVPAAARGEDLKAIAKHVIEQGFNRGDFATINELFSPTYIGHHSTSPDLRGSEEVKQRTMLFRSAFPDGQCTVEDMIKEGDEVAVRFTCRGTHRGPYLGRAPTGKSVTITGITIVRITDGNIQEGWVIVDTLGLLQQLGMLPTLEQTQKTAPAKNLSRRGASSPKLVSHLGTVSKKPETPKPHRRTLA